MLGSVLNALNPIGTASAQEEDSDKKERVEEITDPTQEVRTARYNSAINSLQAVDPTNKQAQMWTEPNHVPTESDVQFVEQVAAEAAIKRVRDFVMPEGNPIGVQGNSFRIRVIPGGDLAEAQKTYDYLSVGGTPQPFSAGKLVRLPGNAGYIGLRPNSSSPNSPAVDITVPGFRIENTILRREMIVIEAEIEGWCNEANVDVTGLCHIASSVENDLGINNQDDIRNHTLQIVRGLVARSVLPGDYNYGDHPDQIEFWPGTPDELLKRIETEWIALGKTPTLAEPICWFALRPAHTEAAETAEG